MSAVTSHPAVQQAQANVGHYVNQLDKELSKWPVAHQFEQRTQIPKAYAVLGAAVLVFFGLFVNALALPISNLVGWALPAYLSFKALETTGSDDDVQWLTYWVTFGTFTFVESFALTMVLHYFPFYFVFKTAFVVWLQLPQTQGARTLYHAVIRPISNNYKQRSSSTPVADADSAAADLRAKLQ